MDAPCVAPSRVTQKIFAVLVEWYHIVLTMSFKLVSFFTFRTFKSETKIKMKLKSKTNGQFTASLSIEIRQKCRLCKWVSVEHTQLLMMANYIRFRDRVHYLQGLTGLTLWPCFDVKVRQRSWKLVLCIARVSSSPCITSTHVLQAGGCSVLFNGRHSSCCRRMQVMNITINY